MAWSRTFQYLKADLGLWAGVDKSHTDQNTTRLPADVRAMIINQARREIALRRDLHFFEAQTTFDTADGDKDYGVASDFLRPYQMWYYDSSNEVVYLEQVSRSKWRSYYSNDASDEDEPEYFCLYGDQFYLAPVPDTIYTIYYDYYKLPSDLSADGDYDDFLVEGYDAILWESCKRACGYLMENTRLPLFTQWADQALGFLSREHSRKTFSASRIQSNISKGS
jgi:hypothetical protein